ncbi:MAG: hypothetical protein M3O66_05820 [Verrucomicrobiota bacterium]|nr:hypothetical protein [Verrucomicrobiota bacterium]
MATDKKKKKKEIKVRDLKPSKDAKGGSHLSSPSSSHLSSPSSSHLSSPSGKLN